MAVIEEFALGVIVSLVANALSSAAGFAGLPYFKQQKIRRRVEIATAEVVEPLLPFLSNEGLSELQQKLLFKTCTDELRPFTSNSEPLFSGSLDGQKIFDDMYAGRELPQAIRDEELESIYGLLCPRIATLLCRIPAAVRDWEANVWTENFSRLDAIAAELRHLFVKLDAVDHRFTGSTSDVLAVARRSLAQRVSMNLDLTGLRADAPVAGKMGDFFVHPQIDRIENNQTAESIGSGDESVVRFTKAGTLGVIFGAPGAGKSTWTRWLQQALLTSDWPGVAVRVELRNLSADALPSVYDLTRQGVTVHVVEQLTVELIQAWIRDRRVVFLLDGFDEISPAHRRPMVDWIVEMATVLHPCPVLITSRPLTTNHLEGMFSKWLRWHIKPFDEKRILDYIQRWYAHMPLLIDSGETPSPEFLTDQFCGDPTIGPLTSNPLLLSTLLMVHHLDGSLPSGRAQLYRRYVDGMLGVWDARRKVTAAEMGLSLAEKRHILTDLAVHLQLQEKEQVDEDEATDVTHECLRKMRKSEDAAAVLSVLRERSGLIVGPGVYSFIHKSVSEFLVAEAAVQGSHIDASGRRIDRFALFEHRADDRWNVIIFLWAGLASLVDVEAFIEQCEGVENIPLGYGILDDQYDRFPPDSKRRLILRLLRLKPNLHEGNHHWMCSGAKCKDWESCRLEIPSGHLRGLQDRRLLPHLLFKAAADGLLLWSDAKGTRGKLRKLIWMSVACAGTDILDWTACIKKLPAGLRTSAYDRWLFWLADSTLNRSFIKTTAGDANAYIEAFCRTHPDHLSLITMAVINNLVLHSSVEPLRMYPENGKEVLLDLLMKCDWSSIPLSLLNATHDWALHAPHDNNEAIDLLATALDEMKSWSDDPLLDARKLRVATSNLSSLIRSRPPQIVCSQGI